MQPSFTLVEADSPLVWTAIHAGHEVREEVAQHMALSDAERRREEDPFTERLLGDEGTHLVAHRSRFEVDLNRPRELSVYLTPRDAWGLQVWRSELPADIAERSRALHDGCFAALGEHLDRLASAGPFLVFDVHSYNHRRGGPRARPADPLDHPEVNVGTGALDRHRWGPIVDGFIDELRSQQVQEAGLDVRENVRFRGGYLSRWVARHYPETGCVMALEFKKTFMDEWTGQLDEAHLDQLRTALATAVAATADRLTRMARTS